MFKQLKTAAILFVILTGLTGLIYPAVVTLAAQVIFPRQANGSLIVKNGQTAGSVLIGQAFDQSKYFWGRLSGTGATPYDASNSAGSNQSVLNPDLQKKVAGRIAALQAADSGNTLPVPVDLVTASASGLDPNISPAAAAYQAARVAKARGIPLERVQTLITQHTEGRMFGFLGEAKVNVLALNLALDALQ